MQDFYWVLLTSLISLFPNLVVNFNFMLRLYSSKPESKEGKEGLEMCLKTLRFMAKGGMYDHIAQVISVSDAAIIIILCTNSWWSLVDVHGLALGQSTG